MEETEYYFEDVNPNKRKIFLIIGLIILLIAIVCFLYYKKEYTLNIKKNITFEIGSSVSYNLNEYITNKIIEEDDYSLNLNGVPIKDEKFFEVGTFTFKIKYKKVTKSGKIKIVDKTAPVVTVNDLTIGLNEDFDMDDFIESCDDYSKPCVVNYVNSKDENLKKEEGEHLVRLSVKDTYKNETTVTAKLIVKNGYDSTLSKKDDLTLSYIDPEDENFNGNYFLKLDKAMTEEELEASEEYANFDEELNSDLHKYLDSLYINNRIDETQVIMAYNKYNYIIGIAVRLTLDNGKIFYITKRI